MKHNLGAMGQLLDVVGQMNGQRFSLLGCDGASTSDDLPVAAIRQLAGALATGGVAGSVDVADGERICGIPVPMAAGRSQLLVAQGSSRGGSAESDPETMLSLLTLARDVVTEQQTQANETTRLAEELNQSYEDLYLFSRVASQIRSPHFSKQMLSELMHEVMDAMRVDLAAAHFPEDPKSNVQVSVPGLESSVPDAAAFVNRMIRDLPASAPAFGEEGFIVNCSKDIPAFGGLHDQPFRVLAVRVESNSKRFGWLLLASFNMNEIFRRGEHKLLRTMAGQVALVMANSELYRDLEHFAMSLVKSLVMVIEAKDLYTKGHSERVSAYCMKMATALGLTAKQRVNLQWASVLHDVGKIGTRECVLNKPAALSSREYAQIREHPVQGAAILQPITPFVDVLPAIRHHHERYDGGGYPDRLVGDAIPFLARIIAVADTYDAITSDRAYRKKRSHEEAMHIIDACSGNQLDPTVVDVFRTVNTAGAGSEFMASERPSLPEILAAQPGKGANCHD